MDFIKRFSGIIAILALVIAGVAIFTIFTKGETRIIERGTFAGTANFSTIEAEEFSSKLASTTNIRIETASTSPFFSAVRLNIGSGQRIDSWYNGTGSAVDVAFADWGFDSGTASSSIRISVLATTTGPSYFTSLYDYTALTDAINGRSTYLVRNQIFATSSTATTTNSHMAAIASNGNGEIRVPNQGYLHFIIQQGDLLGSCTAGGQAGACESATSTNRGIGDFFLKFLYYR